MLWSGIKFRPAPSTAVWINYFAVAAAVHWIEFRLRCSLPWLELNKTCFAKKIHQSSLWGESRAPIKSHSSPAQNSGQWTIKMRSSYNNKRRLTKNRSFVLIIALETRKCREEDSEIGLMNSPYSDEGAGWWLMMQIKDPIPGQLLARIHTCRVLLYTC